MALYDLIKLKAQEQKLLEQAKIEHAEQECRFHLKQVLFAPKTLMCQFIHTLSRHPEGLTREQLQEYNKVLQRAWRKKWIERMGHEPFRYVLSQTAKKTVEEPLNPLLSLLPYLSYDTALLPEQIPVPLLTLGLSKGVWQLSQQQVLLSEEFRRIVYDHMTQEQIQHKKKRRQDPLVFPEERFRALPSEDIGTLKIRMQKKSSPTKRKDQWGFPPWSELCDMVSTSRKDPVTAPSMRELVITRDKPASSSHADASQNIDE